MYIKMLFSCFISYTYVWFSFFANPSRIWEDSSNSGTGSVNSNTNVVNPRITHTYSDSISDRDWNKLETTAARYGLPRPGQILGVKGRATINRGGIRTELTSPYQETGWYYLTEVTILTLENDTDNNAIMRI